MANTDKDIVITPNKGGSSDPVIAFRGANATVGAQTIYANVYPTSNCTVSFEGSAGQLFSITNTLSGTLFSVNDVSGIPSIEVLDTGLIKLAQYGGNVGIGTSSVATGYRLQARGVIADQAGNVRDLVVNPQTGAYILTAGDNGEIISITTGGVTVPGNVFTAGNNITIYNNSAASQTITSGLGITMYLAGTATTGNRTLSQRGVATIICVAAQTFVISGSGLS